MAAFARKEGGIMTTDKPKLHIVSLSGGKDSTAMLLMMLERGMQVDEIICVDTSMEFPQMYEHIDKVEAYIGRPITRLKSEKDFMYYFVEHVITRGKRKGKKGYGWPGPLSRWCTRALKMQVINRHLNQYKKDGYIVERYIGIAYDEQKRKKEFKYPLIDWEITEAEALQYCYDKGFDWGGLYEHFDRASCWCCPLQGLQELRQLRTHYPELWKRLRDMEEKSERYQFRKDYSVEELERRFAFEEKRLAEGLPITGKEFHAQLRRELADV